MADMDNYKSGSTDRVTGITSGSLHKMIYMEVGYRGKFDTIKPSEHPLLIIRLGITHSFRSVFNHPTHQASIL